MAARYHAHCPYCKMYLSHSDRPAYFASPFGTCPHCKNTYIDPQTKELALEPFRPRPIWKLLVSGALSGFTGSIVVELLARWITGNAAVATRIWLISLPILCLITILRELRTRHETEQYDREDWEESDRRLQSKSYAMRLANHGYPVPPRYLPSGFKPDPNAATCKRLRVKLIQFPSIRP